MKHGNEHASFKESLAVQTYRDQSVLLMALFYFGTENPSEGVLLFHVAQNQCVTGNSKVTSNLESSW